MKKIIISIFLLIILMDGNVINAQELYYKNSNGVILTKWEYDKITEFYWEGYQDYLSISDLEFFKKNGLFENEIKTVQRYSNTINPLSQSEHTTASKSLKMSTSCSNMCLVSISLNWISLPKVRSYDILGIYLDGTSATKIDKVFVNTNNGKTIYSYDKAEINGIGTSFKIPDEMTFLNITQTLLVEKKGAIKASYQHAKKSITYSNSKKYSFSKSGIGGVFNFDVGIQDYYDCMLGVQINLN